MAWEWPYDASNTFTNAQEGSSGVMLPTSLVTPWLGPDIKDVIKEILGRAKWAAGNRLAVMLAPDGIWNDQTPPAWDPANFANAGPQVELRIANARLVITVG